ncbi:hypothetical protein ABZ897_38535 [Nonomuraea sp. NPDC046802]|uniref:hypothetical protein n=1 Tax=Nonomuraea sp. NPDC046802 TaxID=3154919 RepID=UPI00340314B2
MQADRTQPPSRQTQQDLDDQAAVQTATVIADSLTPPRPPRWLTRTIRRHPAARLLGPCLAVTAVLVIIEIARHRARRRVAQACSGRTRTAGS